MNRILYLLTLFLLLMSCQKEETVIPTEQSSQLIIHWDTSEYGNSSHKENAMLYLYDNEAAYKNPIGLPLVSKSLADIYPPNGGLITPVSSATFTNLQPIKYWVKIFNAYNHERMVEFNSDADCTFQNPLIENTFTSMTIPTKRIYIKSFTIQKIEIYDIPGRLNLKTGDQVNLSLLEAYPFGYAADDVMKDSKTITMSNSFITYEPANATINSFKSWWCDPSYYVILKDAVTFDEQYYEIDIFKLLNSNKYFGNEYIQLTDQNQIKYKLYVTWNIQ